MAVTPVNTAVPVNTLAPQPGPPPNPFNQTPGSLPINVVEWRWNPTTGQIEQVQDANNGPVTSGSTLINSSVLNFSGVMQRILIELQTLNIQIAALSSSSDLDSIRASLTDV